MHAPLAAARHSPSKLGSALALHKRSEKVQGDRLLPKKVTLWRGNRPPFAFRVPLVRSQYKRNICHYNAYIENRTLQNGGGKI